MSSLLSSGLVPSCINGRYHLNKVFNVVVTFLKENHPEVEPNNSSESLEIPIADTIGESLFFLYLDLIDELINVIGYCNDIIY